MGQNKLTDGLKPIVKAIKGIDVGVSVAAPLHHVRWDRPILTKAGLGRCRLGGHHKAGQQPRQKQP